MDYETSDSASPYGQLEDGVLAVTAGRISWVGAAAEAPEFDAIEQIDGQQGWLTPALIDCHTHLIYGGSRAREFEMRLQGYSYQEISQQGGGIVSTVRATRAASEQELFASGLKRLQRLMAEGVTTVEIKSGYGLDWPTEQRMLKVAGQLAEHTGIEIKRTFLAAHAVPPEYKDRADDYLDLVINEMLPQVAEHNLADAVDVFCEGIGFSHAQTERLFKAAQQYGLPVKGHMEQLSDLKGSRLAAEFNALSVDHLEYLAEEDLPALKAANTVAVLLPGAFYCLKETKLPPVQALFEHQIPVAVSTDLNPGTSPIASLLLAMNQSCLLFGLTPEQALAGVTCHAAQALGLQDRKGQLQVGYQADLVLWSIDHPSELSYAINMHQPQQIWVNGQPRLNPSVSNTTGA
nr:imidazolonepropionase [Oceanospirillum multiglobuliferum]